MSKTTPTQRSLKLLRERGYVAQSVEKWVPQARKRQDLFGFCDIFAVKAGYPPLMVQTTTAANQAARLKKIAATEAAWTCRVVGIRIVVHGWAKKGPRGKRKVWQVNEIEWPDGREEGA